MRAAAGSRSYALDVEYGPPMDRSELVQKHANLARVVLLCAGEVGWPVHKQGCLPASPLSGLRGPYGHTRRLS